MSAAAMPTETDAPERVELKPCPFQEKVDRRGADECWPWLGARNAKGYGNYRSRSAHVVAYEAAHGMVPEGLEVDHSCRNRGCVNPRHLEAVTHQENVRRSLSDTCKRGHKLTPDNVFLYARADGLRRICRECKRITSRVAFKRRER